MEQMITVKHHVREVYVLVRAKNQPHQMGVAVKYLLRVTDSMLTQVKWYEGFKSDSNILRITEEIVATPDVQ